MGLEDDVRKYEVIVAPTNYKRSKAIFTQKMIDDAKKTIQKLGYMESLHRRYANINDISVRNILFVNKSEAIGMKDFDLFDDMKKEVVSKPKKFDRVTEIGIEDFIANVLPTTNAMFVPVTTVMRSPNYWDEQTGIGNKHYFFMLRNCVNPDCPNGFYNEFLKENLMKHKRVFEALGVKTAVRETDNQLSGIGFSTTKPNHLIIKITGATERVLKIKF